MTYMPPAPTPDTIRSLRKAGWSQRELKGFLSSWGLDPDVYAPAEAAGPAVVPPPPAAGQPAAPPAPVAATVDTRVPVAKDTTLPAPPGEQATAMQEAGYSPEAIKAFQAGQGRAATSSVTAEQVQGTGAGKAGLGSIPPPPEEGGGFLGEQPEENYPIQPPAGPAGAQPPPPGVTAQPQPSSLGPLNIGPGGIGQPGALPQEPTEELPPSPEETQAEIARRQGTPGTPPPAQAGAQPGAAPGQPATQPGAAPGQAGPPATYSMPTVKAPWNAETQIGWLTDNGLLKKEDQQKYLTDPAFRKQVFEAAKERLMTEFPPLKLATGAARGMFPQVFADISAEEAARLTTIGKVDVTGGQGAVLDTVMAKLPRTAFYKNYGMEYTKSDAFLADVEAEAKKGTLTPDERLMLYNQWLQDNPDKAAALTPDDKTIPQEIRDYWATTGKLPRQAAGAVTPEDTAQWDKDMRTFESGLGVIINTPEQYQAFLRLEPPLPPGVAGYDPKTQEVTFAPGQKDTPEIRRAADRYRVAKIRQERILEAAKGMGLEGAATQAGQLRGQATMSKAAYEQAKRTGDWSDAAARAYKEWTDSQDAKDAERTLGVMNVAMQFIANPRLAKAAQKNGLWAMLEGLLGKPIAIPVASSRDAVMKSLASHSDELSGKYGPEVMADVLDMIGEESYWTQEEILSLFREFGSAPGVVGQRTEAATRTIKRQG